MSAAATFDQLVERARVEPRIVGLFLGGSRGKGAGVRRDSDYDVRIVLAERDDELSGDLDSGRGGPLEISVTTLAEFRSYAQPGSPTEWDRYTFAHVTVAVDKLDGQIQRLVDQKGSLSPEEADRMARGALDAYMNSLYRSLKRPGLAARIHAAESVGHLLECLFALEGRVRPYHDYLAWELVSHPLDGWPAGELLGGLEALLDGRAEPQQELFCRVEPHVRAHGLGPVVDAWESDLALMRGRG